jgi:hypothetical protein
MAAFSGTADARQVANGRDMADQGVEDRARLQVSTEEMMKVKKIRNVCVA